MKVFACYNIKGGVGKTTTAVNLAYISAKSGKRTLLWDMDIQGSASLLLQADANKEKSVRILSKDRNKIKSYIQNTSFENLDILPADFSLLKLSEKIGEINKPQKRLRNILSSLSDTYENVFIDAPAGYSAFIKSLQRIVDVFLIPVIPTPLTLDSYELLKKQLKKHSLENLIVFPFFSMVDRRKQLHREIIGLHKNGTRGFLQNHIPFSSNVERMATEFAPLLSYDSRSAASRAYKKLWEEVNTNIGMYERVKQIKMW